MATEFAQARRGDLVAIVREHHDFVIGQDSLQERTTVDLGIVTSISREGLVKAYRSTWGSDVQLRYQPSARVLVVSAATVDAQAAYEAAKQHTYDGHPDQSKPFDSVDEARSFVRQFAKGQSS